MKAIKGIGEVIEMEGFDFSCLEGEAKKLNDSNILNKKIILSGDKFELVNSFMQGIESVSEDKEDKIPVSTIYLYNQYAGVIDDKYSHFPTAEEIEFKQKKEKEEEEEWIQMVGRRKECWSKFSEGEKLNVIIGQMDRYLVDWQGGYESAWRTYDVFKDDEKVPYIFIGTRNDEGAPQLISEPIKKFIENFEDDFFLESADWLDNEEEIKGRIEGLPY